MESVFRNEALWLLLLVSSVFSLVREEIDSFGCIEGRRRCNEDATCRGLLETVPRVCDKTIFTCHTDHRLHCRSVLSSLQEAHYFRSCTCDPADEEARGCLDLQQFIFLHACASHNEGSHNAPWLRPRQPTVTREAAPSSEELEEIEDSLDRKLSCIGVRQLCLRNLHCSSAFEEFRIHCTENKKKGTCVAEDRDACFRAMENLGNSQLFDCECPSHIKSQATLEKCQRIQYRVANNTCLVAVPYYVYSVNPSEPSYKELVDVIGSDNQQLSTDGVESNCLQAFAECHKEGVCRLRMSEMMTSCEWNRASLGCNRELCLQAIQNFFLLVRPEKSHGLLFCRCHVGDGRCETVRQGMYPTCSLVQDPPPTCLQVLDSCLTDNDCRVRWGSYQKYCSYDKTSGGCTSGSAMCRNAQVGIMGTILTTNCTCAMLDPEENKNCRDARERLQQKNVCKEMAMRDFHVTQMTTTQSYWVADGGMALVGGTPECKRQLTDLIPYFMDMPNVVRVYDNDSECSEVCQCLRNGTIFCRRLPCSPGVSCKFRNITYAHGSSFNHPERGQCRCIRGEIVCAKPQGGIRLVTPGLYLHVGYSVSDQYLVEGNSALIFQPLEVADKLGALLNEDSAEQFCSFALRTRYEGNLIFGITPSPSSPLSAKNKNCVPIARALDYKVNARDPVITADAQLSILKVSQLENVRIYEPLPVEKGQPHKDMYADSWSAATSQRHSYWIILTAVLFACSASFLPSPPEMISSVLPRGGEILPLLVSRRRKVESGEYSGDIGGGYLNRAPPSGDAVNCCCWESVVAKRRRTIDVTSARPSDAFPATVERQTVDRTESPS